MTSVTTTSNRSRRSLLIAGLLGLVVLIGGCASDTPLDTLEP